MRALTLVAMLGVAGIASADRLITIPTGTKIPFRQGRAEYLFEASRTRSMIAGLGFGITESFDMELRADRFADGNTVGTLDLAYNYIGPIVDFGPGISIGVQDLMNNTEDGRRFYFAITSREALFGSLNSDLAAEVTIGAMMGTEYSAPFVGVMLPFSNELRALVEHNGRRLAAGIEIRPRPDLGLRLVFRDQDTMLGAQWNFRF